MKVTITAENRDYRKGDTTATGIYTLWDVRPDGTESQLSESLGLGLAGLTYQFAQETPGNGITVTATWTGLTGNENGLYALINQQAQTTANIERITEAKMTVTPPTVSGTYEYGTRLGDITADKLTGGSVQYNEADVAGTWSWETPSTDLLQIGDQTYNLRFTPDPDVVGVGYDSVTRAVTVTVTKKTVTVPALSGTFVYNGSTQKPTIPASSLYTVVSNDGGINAGPYTVTLKLEDAEHYKWAGSDEATADLSWTITPADIAVSGKATVTRLGYGQQLTDGEKETVILHEHSKNETTATYKLPASDMISGLSCTYTNSSGGRSPVNGKWQWDLTGLTQPLNASDTPYSVNATFVPSEPDNFKPTVTRTFQVKVDKAVPDVIDAGLYADSMYQSKTSQHPLENSLLHGAGQVVNPNTGERIYGSWDWEDPNAVPVPQSEYDGNDIKNTVFTPEDTINYEKAQSTATVPLTTLVTVTVGVYIKDESSGKTRCLSEDTMRVQAAGPYIVQARQGISASCFDWKWYGKNISLNEVRVNFGGRLTPNWRLYSATSKTTSNGEETVSGSEITATYNGQNNQNFNIRVSFNDATYAPDQDNIKLSIYFTTSDTITFSQKAKKKAMKAITETKPETETEAPTEPATEAPSTEPVTEPSTEPVTEAPATEPSTEPVTEAPATEPSTEPVTEAPATEPSTEPATEAPPTEPVTEASTEAPTEAPETTPPTEAPTEPPTEAPAEPATEALETAPPAEPVTEAALPGETAVQAE